MYYCIVDAIRLFMVQWQYVLAPLQLLSAAAMLASIELFSLGQGVSNMFLQVEGYSGEGACLNGNCHFLNCPMRDGQGHHLSGCACGLSPFTALFLTEQVYAREQIQL